MATKKQSTAEKIVHIPLAAIDDFPNHPFQVRDDDEMDDMALSVEHFGVVTPAVVRLKADGRFELISGHRRKRASELAGRDTLPAVIRDLDDEAAVLLMVDSNLQRTNIRWSEKAHSFKMKLEAMKRQGERTDHTSSPSGTRLRTDEVIAQEAGESRNQVQRTIRLTYLIPELLQMVDEGKIAFRPAVEISYLVEKEQRFLLDQIELTLATPSVGQALKMKELSKAGRLTKPIIASILAEPKPNQKENVKVPRERLTQYFPKDATPKQIEETIIKALELLRKREHSRAMER
jgi:ParB family chromosome partitioning protein